MDEFKSGYIRVTMDNISYKNVCDYYNQNKPDDWKPICEVKRNNYGWVPLVEDLVELPGW